MKKLAKVFLIETGGGMAISKARKQALVTQYQELAKRSNGMILTSYSGLTVKELEGLRNQMRELGGEFHIVKNTLMELAFKELDLPLPDGATEGTTAIGFATDEVPPIAKAIVDLSREGEAISLKGGIVDGELVDGAKIIMLADLPPMPVVQAQLLSVLTTPSTQVAGLLAGALRQVVGVMSAYARTESAEAA
jgi:large subunit ribosomal protein L10